MDVFGNERGNPLVAAEEHLAVPPPLVTAPREVIAPHTIRDVIVPERARRRIEAGDALLAADPQPASGIFENTHEIVVRQPIALRVAREHAHSSGRTGTGPVRRPATAFLCCPRESLRCCRLGACGGHPGRACSAQRCQSARRSGSRCRPRSRPRACRNDPDG